VADVLSLVGLHPLMQRTTGRPDVVVGLIDGPVALDHPDLERDRLRPLAPATAPRERASVATRHGTFVAGILIGRRGSAAPALCPGCSVVSRPVFADGGTPDGEVRSTPAELARAIDDCLDAGARVLNVSAALTSPVAAGASALTNALDRAARRGALVVVAAGNDGAVGGSLLTGHPWVVPVTACTSEGRPAAYSTLGLGIGRRGLSAPGDRITSLATTGGVTTLSGTSAAVPFVTGTMALLWSASPRASVDAIRHAILSAGTTRRAAIVPPLLNAWAAHLALTGGRA
jgi:subtilisin family serine protease